MVRFVVVAALAAGLSAPLAAQGPAAVARPRVGVAFGGGSARGLAHVGVIRWLEEHRVPIDLVAGTSMGGLVGGAYASGMSSAELAQLLRATDWDEMFGNSTFRYKNVRRKQDARAYPAHLEFGYRKGVIPPPALNNGQQVELLLSRIAGAYPSLPSFDALPTPFRCVATDLVTARPVILDRGWLAGAMRATMSLPGVFPPVDLDGHVLVDGGAMNNVPADVVRAMGADVVIAVPVGDHSDTRVIDRSVYALPDETVGAMMRASTRVAMKRANIVINPAREFGSLAWRQSAQLEASGYAAAESQKAKLLPLALDEAQWAEFLAARNARRRAQIATPSFAVVNGATGATRDRMQRAVQAHVGRPLDLEALEATLEAFAGLDRYATVNWRLVERPGEWGLEIVARPKGYAPPFFMSGVSLENTTTELFSFQLAARYLAFDLVGAESELRLDAAVGARPNLGAELYRPMWGSRFFIAPRALARRQYLQFVRDGNIVAAYEERRAGVAFDVGLDVGHDDELRLGAGADWLRTFLRVGNPLLPELDGMETTARARWLHDGQDSPVVPSRGTRMTATVEYVGESPEVDGTFDVRRSNDALTQAELRSSTFWSLGRSARLFLVAGGGSSFDGAPLPTRQFTLGRPFHLGAYGIGELRGDNYAVATIGYLRRIGRLPDFLGGPAFAGAWIENGSTFDELDDAKLYADLSVGAVTTTLVGPALVGASVAVDGRWRTYLGIGRLF